MRCALFRLKVIAWAGLLLAGSIAIPQTFAQQPALPKDPACTKDGDSFQCVGDLDGDGSEQNITGYVTYNGGYLVIIEKNGTVRKRICWSTDGAPVCPNMAAALLLSPSTGMTATGFLGGPFLPGSFGYQISAASGSVDYSISGVPAWLTASSTSGSVTTSPTTLTFTINGNANSLTVGSYVATITFTNTAGGSGTQTRIAKLDVIDPNQKCSQEAMLCGDGTIVTRTGPNCAFAQCPQPGNTGSRVEPKNSVPVAPRLPPREALPKSSGDQLTPRVPGGR